MGKTNLSAVLLIVSPILVISNVMTKTKTRGGWGRGRGNIINLITTISSMKQHHCCLSKTSSFRTGINVEKKVAGYF
jgi:hypothetical protein